MDTPRLINTLASKLDATVKYTFQSSEGYSMEIAFINKSDGKYIFCVPTQTNCAMACRFCHTTALAGKVPVINLSAFEIAEAVKSAWWWTRASLNTDPFKPLLISYMGCGEPTANAKSVVESMLMLRDWAKLSGIPIRFAIATMLPAKHLGDFRQFATDVALNELNVKVHLSLHFTADAIRRRFMPAASPVQASLGLLRWYQGLTGNAVELHYTLINGVNDDLASIEALAAMIEGPKFPVKFLQLTETPGQPYRPTDPNWVTFIRNFFAQKKLPVEFYDPPGRDCGASCGQFITSNYLNPQVGTLVAIAPAVAA